MQSSSNNELNQNYIINIGRIEGVRFYLEEQQGLSGNSENSTPPSQPQVENAMEEKVLMYNSTGLTLIQNLKPAARHKGKKSERTIVGYCMIAIRGLVKDETSDKILTTAFRNDYFPNDNIDKFSASVYRVLRSYSNKGSKTVHNPDEQWGDQKEAILQEVKTQIRKATSGI